MWGCLSCICNRTRVSVTASIAMTSQLGIPSGIIFSSSIALIPSILPAFSHSGSLNGAADGYQWIDRGACIGRYFLKLPRSGVPFLDFILNDRILSADIRSPVSGLLIHSTYDFCHPLVRHRTAPVATTSILIPRNERAPENGSYMFRDFYKLVGRNCSPFLKPSRFWSMDGIGKETFDALLLEQIDQEVRLIPALPYCRSYLEEISRMYPEVESRFLRHLG